MRGAREALRARVLEPLRRQLTQGAAPGELALALALGLTIGSLPVLGVTTVTCAALAAALRLNQPAIQVANYAAYPLQLGLFIPFFRAGAWIFGVDPVPFRPSQVRQAFAEDPLAAIAAYGAANARAVVAWAIVAPAAVIVLRLVLRPVLARIPLPRGAPEPPSSRGPP